MEKKYDEVEKIATPSPFFVVDAANKTLIAHIIQKNGDIVYDYVANFAFSDHPLEEDEANAVIFVHCRNQFGNLITALEQATNRIENFYGAGSINNIDENLLKELHKALASAKEINDYHNKKEEINEQ